MEDDEDVEKIFLEENFDRGKILSGVSKRYNRSVGLEG